MKFCVKTQIVALLLGLVVADVATAQRQRRDKRQRARAGETESAPARPSATEEDADLVTSLEMFVYPAGGQSAEQQTADEAECATWAQDEIAAMPEADPQLEEDATGDDGGRREGRRGGDRSGLKGAAKGAVVGAALEDDEPELPKSHNDIGDNVKGSPPESRDEVGDNVKHAQDDDGPSATEIGAAAGLVAGRRRGKKAEANAEAQAAKVEQETAELAEGDSLRRALKVCLEAKGYTVE